jgi:iron complex outermembrane recepter protein
MKKSLLPLAILSAVGITHSAVAQIEEVVITATKRAQSMQDVPIAVTAFNADTLERERVTGVGDIASKTPGFYISQQSPSDPEMTIRGIGSTDREAGSDRSVVMFIDEIYIGRSGGTTIDLMDIEQVEVLRGPQGTLFGRNVVGGAVSVTTAKPSEEAYQKYRATLGNYDLREVAAVFNAPISDSVLSRFSISKKDRDGVHKNLNTGNMLDGINSLSLRGALKLLPSDSVEVNLSAEYSHDEVDGIHARVPIVAGVFGPIDNFTVSSDLHDVTLPIDGMLDRDVWGLTARVDWDIDLGRFTSLTSYRVSDFAQDRDLTAATVPGTQCSEPSLDTTVECFLSREIIDENSSTFTQELRLASESDGDFNWITGLYYLLEDTDRDQERKRRLSRDGNVTSSDPLFEQVNETVSYAIFGETNYNVTENLVLTVGARWTHDEKTLDLDVTDLDPNNLITNALNPAQEEFSVRGESESWEEFTPKINLAYHLDDGSMAYITWSKGYKSGGFNGQAGLESSVRIPFEPETVTNLELGLKSQFWDDRVRLNLSLYQMQFEDLQLRRRLLIDPNDQSTNTIVIGNAKEAEIKGFEGEFTLAPTDAITFSATYAYTGSELTDPEVTVGIPGVSDDGLSAAKGDPLPRAPENSVTLAADYRVELSAGELSFQIDYAWLDEIYFDLGTPKPGGFQDEYGLLNGSINFTTNSGEWGLTLWAKNLEDKQYWVQQQPLNGGATAVGRVGEPRTFGLTVSWEPEF